MFENIETNIVSGSNSENGSNIHIVNVSNSNIANMKTRHKSAAL